MIAATFSTCIILVRFVYNKQTQLTLIIISLKI